MDYFAAVRAFSLASELGSFSKTAETMDVKTSTISRYISDLEKDLGIALFNRSTRGLVLTEGGRVFRKHALLALRALDEGRQVTSSLNQSPTGMLRVTVPSVFGRKHIVPHLPEFMRRYPAIDVDMVITDENLNLIESEIDLAVRIGVLPDSTMIAKRLAPHRRIVCGSPEYLKHNKVPLEPGDLPSHNTLRQSLLTNDKWRFVPAGAKRMDAAQISVELNGNFRANDSDALHEMAIAGVGLALLPTWLACTALHDGRLVHILREWEARMGLPEPAIWMVYPPKRIVSSKVRAFVDFYVQMMGDSPYWET
jgi:DNA-binding transcriptional LysR family regulator